MVAEVSMRTGIPVEVILGRNRTPIVVCARQLYWKLLRRRRLTFREISELCDRDTSTVSIGVNRIEGLLQSGDKLATDMWTLIKDIDR